MIYDTDFRKVNELNSSGSNCLPQNRLSCQENYLWKREMNLITWKYMKILKLLNLIVLLVLFIIGCARKTSDERYLQINNEIREIYQMNIKNENVKYLIFINDYGCFGCIKSFLGYILNNINRFEDNRLIFTSSKGVNVDIDKSISSNTKNVVISRNIRRQGEIIPNLGIVYLKENTIEVDTIISIDALIISEQLAYIENRE